METVNIIYGVDFVVTVANGMSIVTTKSTPEIILTVSILTLSGSKRCLILLLFTPSGLRRDSYAPKPPLQRTPGMLTEKSTFPSTHSTDVGRVCPVGIIFLVVLG